MARLTLILGVLATVIYLLDGFRFVVNEWRHWRNKGTWIILIFLYSIPTPVFALTEYYVDPDYTGGTRNGNASTPWQSLSDTITNVPWTVINAALASDAVTVYFSARESGSDTSEASTVSLTVSRTDSTTNRLTLDGISQYNTNDATPSWSAYITPSSTNYIAASKFQITPGTYALQSSAVAATCQNYITVRGMKFVTSSSDFNYITYTGNLIVEYIESIGAFFIGPANSGAGCGGSGPPNVTVQYSFFHETYGECLYIGASSPGPPGVGNVSTGDNYLIRGNRIEACASRGGQNDGIDIKDGHTNLRVINNVIRATLSPSAYSASGASGISVESGALIDGNYIEIPDRNCVSVFDSWHNDVGRGSLDLRNNICVDVNTTFGHNNGFELFDLASATWGPVTIENNTFRNVFARCVVVDATWGANTVTLRNNIFSDCLVGGFSASAGQMLSHDYNIYSGTGASSISYSGTFACADVASSEAHSLCVDPLFVNASAPYTDTNFRLQTGSPARNAGANLSSTFTNDYANSTRTVPWDIGAFVYAPEVSQPVVIARVVRWLEILLPLIGFGWHLRARLVSLAMVLCTIAVSGGTLFSQTAAKSYYELRHGTGHVLLAVVKQLPGNDSHR